MRMASQFLELTAGQQVCRTYCLRMSNRWPKVGRFGACARQGRRTGGIGLLLFALLLARPAAAVECWTGWGYWIDPQTRAYRSERLLLATRGPVDWVPGAPVLLYRLDEQRGGFDESMPPLTVFPGPPRFSYRAETSLVTLVAAVAGRRDHLSLGLSHVKQTAFGLARLDQFYRWACGLSRERG